MRIYHNWEIAGYERPEAVKLCRAGLNPLVAVVLASRGETDMLRARALIDGAAELSDPLEIVGMDAAAARVRKAIADNEHVAVYGDYDVDGITASSLVADYLRSRGLECEVYIPERLEEGYGINAAALRRLHDRGVSLVVTVDCGITAVAEAKSAREMGLDLVITDHHECCGELPDAVAVVDPCGPGSDSPARVLAGVGVAFKLVCAVEGPDSGERLLDEYGDLVATGTVADVMPMTGENRLLVRRGIAIIREGRRDGLRELCAAAGIEFTRLTAQNIGYGLAPRINAAGRIGDTAAAVQLLLTRDPAEAAELAATLCAWNRERQRLEAEMTADAGRLLEGAPETASPVVLASESWHQGVAGIVASRVAEKLGLPAIMICLRDGVGRGSCRSVDGYNIHAALSEARDLLVNFGGHEMAAGLTIKEENIPALRERLARDFKLPDTFGARKLSIDFEVVKPELLSLANVAALERLEPWGMGNPQPVLCILDAAVDMVIPLSEGRHTRFRIVKDGTALECVYFCHGPDELGLATGAVCDVAFTPQVNEFHGRRSVQLYVNGIYVK